MRQRKFLTVGLAIACLVASAGAQIMRAKVAGTVKDENGQPMGGVWVIFHNNENGQTFEMKTGEPGKKNVGQYDGMVIPSDPGGMTSQKPLGYDVMLKRDKKDAEPLAVKRRVLIYIDPATNAASLTHSDVNVVNFDLQADRAQSMGMPSDTGQLTAEQKKKLAEYQAQKTAAESENKKRGNLNQLLAQARAASASGNNDLAVTTMKQATEAGPTYALIWGQLGTFQIDQSRKTSDRTQRAQIATEAVISMKKAIELCGADPKQSGCTPANVGQYHGGLAKAYALSNDMKSAGAEYEQAAQLDPASAADYWFRYGADLTNASQADAANAAFDKAIAADPKYADAYLRKGENLLSKATVDPKTGKQVYPPEAATNIQKYLELKPDGPYAELARQYLQFMGQKAETSYKAEKKK
jgi:tetratricopeptide (TPR) repeat protein